MSTRLPYRALDFWFFRSPLLTIAKHSVRYSFTQAFSAFCLAHGVSQGLLTEFRAFIRFLGKPFANQALQNAGSHNSLNRNAAKLFDRSSRETLSDLCGVQISAQMGLVRFRSTHSLLPQTFATSNAYFHSLMMFAFAQLGKHFAIVQCYST